MKSLHDYFLNILMIESLNDIYFDIDSENINETLNCDCLKQLAKQLKDQKIEDKKNGTWNVSNNFKEIFAGHDYGSRALLWDKITDSDIEFIDADEWNTRSGYLKPKIRKIINGKTDHIFCLVQDKETKQFIYYIKRRQPIYLYKKDYIKAGKETTGLNQGDIIDKCVNKNLYFIDTSKKLSIELRNQRYKEKQNMVYLDEYSLQRMADENRQRYKKFVEQNKALASNDDELIDKCNKIVEEVTKFISTIAKDPISNADYICDANNIAKYVYDTQRYISGSNPRKPGYYSGVDGIIPLLMAYAKSKKESAESGSSYNSDIYKRARKGLEKAIEKIYEIADSKNLPINLPR